MEGIRRLLVVEPCHKIVRCPTELRGRCPVYSENNQPCWASESVPPCCDDSGRICQCCQVYLKSQQSPMLAINV
jgi:hypothetical protein